MGPKSNNSVLIRDGRKDTGTQKWRSPLEDTSLPNIKVIYLIFLTLYLADL